LDFFHYGDVGAQKYSCSVREGVPDKLSYTEQELIVLSSEMDPAEIRLIRKVVIEERGEEMFWKNPPAPHPLRAL
jgi:hypothetical protein